MPESKPPRVGILISGRGSNMVALIDAMRAGRVPAEPAVVISNVKGAPGLKAAAERQVETVVLEHTTFPRREAHERAMIEVLARQRVDIVCLAGYMRRLSPFFVGAFSGRILNVHPALLPA